MRKYLYIFAMVMSTLALFAQEPAQSSFRVYALNDTSVIYQNGDTIVITLSSLDKAQENALINVKNSSTNDITANMRQRVFNRIEGAAYSFCFGNCYEDNGQEVLEGETSVTIKAGQFSEDLCMMDYNPNGNAGTTFVRYTVYNVDNTDDSTCVVIKYDDSKVGIAASETEGMRLSVSPNPASTTARIHISGCNLQQPELRICNLLGSVVYSQKISTADQMIHINVNNWNNGVYFYSIWDGNKNISTQKMIVAH